MRTAGRLSIIALIVIIAAAALAAGERATALVNAPPSAVTPIAPRETSISTRTLLASPWQDADASAAEPNAERDKTLAWVLLLLKEHRNAR